MSQGYEEVIIKHENMGENVDYVPQPQPLYSLRVEPTNNGDYLPETQNLSPPILEIGSVYGEWDKKFKPDSSNPFVPTTDKSAANPDDVKIYACEVCDYRTRLKQSLISHRRNHTGEKPYACTHCSYKTGKPGNLTVHIRKHTGEKPYACDQCDYRGSQRISLINHKKTHSGEKPFVCEICNYRTSFRGNLIQHKRKHTGEKPFGCGQCDFKSSQRTPWLTHIKKHHGNGPVICDQCGFSFDTVDDLTDHRKSHGNPFNPLISKSNLNPADFHCWNQGRPSGVDHLPSATITFLSKPSTYQTVEAFNTILRWAAENAKNVEEIETLKRMRLRALEHHLSGSFRKSLVRTSTVKM